MCFNRRRVRYGLFRPCGRRIAGWSTRAGDGPSRPGYRVLPRSADCHFGPHRLGRLAQSVGFNEEDFEAASSRRSGRRTGGLTLSFACPCVGAHKQKDEPTSDCSCDGHVRLEGAAVPALHIRSAIFKISQPKAVKATHQKSMTDTLPFAFYMKPTPLAARPQVTNCESQIGAKPAARTPLLKQASFSVVKGAARSRR
jgi:hypothetical protein